MLDRITFLFLGRAEFAAHRGVAISSLDEKLDQGPEAAAHRRSTAGEATRKRLQQVALDLFWKKGYRSTTTRDVAASLGVQQASLYYHMKNKEDLLHGICYSSFLQVVENAEAAVAGVSPQPPDDDTGVPEGILRQPA